MEISLNLIGFTDSSTKKCLMTGYNFSLNLLLKANVVYVKNSEFLQFFLCGQPYWLTIVAVVAVVAVVGVVVVVVVVVVVAVGSNSCSTSDRYSASPSGCGRCRGRFNPSSNRSCSSSIRNSSSCSHNSSGHGLCSSSSGSRSVSSSCSSSSSSSNSSR